MTSKERNEKWWAAAFAWLEAKSVADKARARAEAHARAQAEAERVQAHRSLRLMLALLALLATLSAIELNEHYKELGPSHFDKVQLMRLIDRGD